MIERFTDGVTVLVAPAIGIAAIGTDSEFAPLVASLISAGSVVFAALGVALYILGSGVAERLTRRIPAVSTRFFALAESLATVPSQRMISVLAASFVVWLFDGAAMWGILVACGVRLDVLAMCLAVGVVSLSTLLPSPPGFLGTMQFAFAIAASTFGYSWSQGSRQRPSIKYSSSVPWSSLAWLYCSLLIRHASIATPRCCGPAADGRHEAQAANHRRTPRRYRVSVGVAPRSRRLPRRWAFSGTLGRRKSISWSARR